MRTTFLLLASGLAFLALTSCDDDDSVWGDTRYSHRIAQIVNSTDGVEECHNDFIYENDKLIRVVHSHETVVGEGDWQPVSKYEYTYEGNEVLEQEYWLEDGVWIEYWRAKYLVWNGLIVEEIEYEQDEDDLWFPESCSTMEYSGSRVQSWKEYRYMYGSRVQIGFGSFKYQGDHISEMKAYEYTHTGNVLLEEQMEVSFVSGLPVEYLWSFRDDDNMLSPESKSVYEYQQQRVSAIENFDWYESLSSWQKWVRTEFSYNQDGDLSEEQRTWYNEDGSEGGINSNTYIYEEGDGNASTFELFYHLNEDAYPRLKSASEDVHSAGKRVPYYKRAFLKGLSQ